MSMTIEMPQDFVMEWGDEPGRRRTGQRAILLLERWDGWQSGHPARCVAAAMVYEASLRTDDEPPLTQREVADDFDTTTKTIRNVLEKFREETGDGG